MQTHILCKDLTGTPVPLLTITEKVETYMDYYDEVQLSRALPNVLRKQLHKKYVKAKKLFR